MLINILCVCVCVYLAPIKTQPRLLAMCEHLPESDSKHPCVCGMGECAGLQTLRGAPASERNTNISMECTLSQSSTSLSTSYAPFGQRNYF